MGYPYQPGEGYRRVGNKLALDLGRIYWRLGGTQLEISEILEILTKRGFQYQPAIDANEMVLPVYLAKQLRGGAQYQVDALLSQAPEIFNCSTFTAWLYGQIGIELPPTAFLQNQFGYSISIRKLQNEPRPGDLLFTKGNHPRFVSDPTDGIGHVGIVSNEGTLIHITKIHGVAEIPLKKFISSRSFRGAVRIVDDFRKLYIVTIPRHFFAAPDMLRNVETSERLLLYLMDLTSDQ
jgi:cell wall-associated NlpC family hydrolase